MSWVATLESKDPRICRDEGGKKSMMRKNVFEEKTKKNQVGKDTHQENTLGRGRGGNNEKYIAQ